MDEQSDSTKQVQRDVETIISPTYDEFINQYLKPCKPVVVKNATPNWPAHQTWDFAFFQKKYGDRQVKIDGKCYNFSKFIDLVLEGNDENPAPYLRELNIPINFPELMFYLCPDIQYTLPNRLTSKLLPKVLERSWGMRKGMVELLIGGKGSGFPFLHYDLFKSHGFVTQICGDKEFYLYSPVDSEYLYPKNSQKDISSIKNIEDFDLHQFPLFAKAKKLRVIVKQGESIFIPSGWWHTTKIVTPSIAVLVNFMNADKWSALIDESYWYYRNYDSMKREILRAYLLIVGVLMTWNESRK
jgi:histone arginine demethylase JMJD6